MNTDMIAPVVAYCAQEVMRQGHDTTKDEGIVRVAWMLDAWCYALGRQFDSTMGMPHDPPAHPTVDDVIQIGKRIEQRENAKGLRQINVAVGSRLCPSWEKVPALLVEWGERWRDGAPHPAQALAAYRELLEIHPFADGNGRTSKVILNWLRGSLLAPVFPPADFWGHPIQNP